MTNITEVENKIITLRGQKVILDADVAALYEIETRDINKAVKNNPDKFPEGYVMQLNAAEKEQLVENFHQFNRLKHSPVNPKAFTEKGLYMLATILKSPKAVVTTIAIVEAYAKLRDLTRVMTEIPQYDDDRPKQESLLQRGGQLVDDLLHDMMPVQSSETSLELNLAMVKIKHTVRRENNDEIEKLKARIAELEAKAGR
ncbi:MAG: ORF6N domain-containing protein [Bacteroidales bacterium]|nr:ORF6N domain-containing protein [Bacteroidales bacterium]